MNFMAMQKKYQFLKKYMKAKKAENHIFYNIYSTTNKKNIDLINLDLKLIAKD